MYLDPVYPAHGPFAKVGFLPIPLETVRELSSGSTINAAGIGGVLASDTTPIFDTVNGDTDGAFRIEWVANDVHPIAFQTVLPPDFDNSVDLKLKILAEISGSTPWDTCTVASDTYFNVADTKVEDSVAITGGDVVEWTVTIATADIPFGAKTVSIELTPGAHANDALYVYALWLEFEKL